MAKKQIAKKEECCTNERYCFCKAILAVIIIVLVWVSQEMWSKIVITILAALVIIGAGGCMCRKNKPVKK